MCCVFYFFQGVAVMPQGTIKKLIADKGFGFIDGERGDLFFHHSAVEGTSIEALRVGQAVTYEEGRGPKGPRAENVKPV
jgi:CspA family cold shock protein